MKLKILPVFYPLIIVITEDSDLFCWLNKVIWGEWDGVSMNELNFKLFP